MSSGALESFHLECRAGSAQSFNLLLNCTVSASGWSVDTEMQGCQGRGRACPTVWPGQEGPTQRTAKGSTRGWGATSRKWPRESREPQAWEDTKSRTQRRWDAGLRVQVTMTRTPCPGFWFAPRRLVIMQRKQFSSPSSTWLGARQNFHCKHHGSIRNPPPRGTSPLLSDLTWGTSALSWAVVPLQSGPPPLSSCLLPGLGGGQDSESAGWGAHPHSDTRVSTWMSPPGKCCGGDRCGMPAGSLPLTPLKRLLPWPLSEAACVSHRTPMALTVFLCLIPRASRSRGQTNCENFSKSVTFGRKIFFPLPYFWGHSTEVYFPVRRS